MAALFNVLRVKRLLLCLNIISPALIPVRIRHCSHTTSHLSALYKIVQQWRAWCKAILHRNKTYKPLWLTLTQGPSHLGSLPSGDTSKRKSWKARMDLGRDPREGISFYRVDCHHVVSCGFMKQYIYIYKSSWPILLDENIEKAIGSTLFRPWPQTASI